MGQFFLSARLATRLVCENPIDVRERVWRLFCQQNPGDLLRVQLSDLLQMEDELSLVLVVAWNVKDAISLDDRDPPEAL